ncbi:MAG: 50S ribosomal protein L6 [Acidobacteria bacterium]|nr:50S ribosomal protein L6 [Acidobacteriota bacterium]MBI3657632.1 50S ribosomal protein L6 [Acidobacteriota bacterium]
MSRVGKKPIKIPANVKIRQEEGQLIVEGPKGKLSSPIYPGISIETKEGCLVVARDNDAKRWRALHGLVRALAANAVTGVTEGFRVEMDLVGIGYKAEVRGSSLFFSLGYSHPIEYPIPSGITVKIEKLPRTIQNYITTLVLSGFDKAKLGQFAANIRALRPPDPYKGKGLRYKDERIKLKVGKKAA